MNRPQAIFLGSFVGFTCVLFSLSHLLVSKFNAADIYFSDIILIGLPKDPKHPELGSHTFSEMVQDVNFRSFDIPYVGPVDLVETANSPIFLISAGLLVATFVLTKLIGGSSCFTLSLAMLD